MFSEEDDEDEIDWENLKTISIFDGLDNSYNRLYNLNPNTTTRQVNGNIMERVAAKATTPVSLLVESLVQQLCTMLESDPGKSSQLYNIICEQLYKMNLIDETFSMGEFETMRSQYQRALYQLVSVARGQDLPMVLQNVWPLTQPIGMDWSRYYREFEELDFIAGGGFGKVYRARHKLDGSDYAIKKITIKSTTINHILSHLSEVKTLASLNHINIVPYKAAWLEPLIANVSENKNNTDSSDSSSEEEPEIYNEEQSNESSLDFIEFRNEDEDSVKKDIESSKPESKHIIAKFKKQISVDTSQPHIKLKWATLYIQMTLCQLTLREWLDNRNKFSNFDEFYINFVKEPKNIAKYNINALCSSRKLRSNPKTSVSSDEGILEEEDGLESFQHPTHVNIVSDIFAQLLNGLHYIHSRGIVHHDIKPSNIFVALENNGKMIIQLGDFGLACPLQNAPHSTQGFGTPLYAAPEQLGGECNPKSDIYSLGIVLLELLLPFSTDMERVDSIKKIRIGNIPKDINTCYGNLVKRLLQCCRKRPDTFQLVELMNRMNSTKDNIIIELQKRLSEQNSKIELLQNQLSDEQEFKIDNQSSVDILKTKDEEIEKLKLKIKLLQDRDDELKSKENEILRLKKLLKENEKSLDNL